MTSTEKIKYLENLALVQSLVDSNRRNGKPGEAVLRALRCKEGREIIQSLTSDDLEHVRLSEWHV